MRRLELLFALILFPAAALCQDATGRVLGTVIDASGAAVPDAAVTVTNAATQVTRVTRTNTEGFYQVLQVPIGAYGVTAEKAGFAKSTTAAEKLSINQSLRIDVRLEVGSTSQTVQVEGTASGVETVNSGLGGAITSRPIVDLPLNGRNVLDLMGLQAGVTEQRPSGGPTNSMYSVAGGRTDSTSYYLDGGLNNNLIDNSVVFNPNPDTIEEFRILTNNHAAEFGRNAGGIVSVVTKSGTNELHGSVFDYVRNDYFNANTFFNNRDGAPRPVLKRNQFGAAVGGPIVLPKLVNGRNRAFFMASYQGQRQSATTITSAVPVFTPAELTGDFSRSDNGLPDPAVVSFLQANPYYQSNPNSAARGIIDPAKIDSVARNYITAGLIPFAASGQVTPSGAEIRNRDEITGKTDLVITDNDRIAITLGAQRAPSTVPFGFNGGNTPGLPYTGNMRDYLANVSYTKIFSPELLNELRVVAQRANGVQAKPGVKAPTPQELRVQTTPDDATGPPLLGFADGLTVGFSPQGPTTIINNTYNFSDMITWTRGRHSLKAGFQFSPYQGNIKYDFYVNGSFFFYGPDTSVGSGNGRADFLMGLADEYFQSAAASTNIRSKWYAAFFQDEWRATKNLTPTLGVRYEYAQPKLDTAGRSFSLALGKKSTVFPNAPTGLLFPGDPCAPRGANFPDRNDWAPRFGFAWNPGGRNTTSIRGGFGVFYDILKAEDNLQYNGQAPFFGYADLLLSPSDGTGPATTMSDPFGNAGAVNPFPSRPPAQNIDFGAAGYLPFAGGGVYFVNPHLRTPYVYHYNLSVQRQVARDLVAEVSYVGSSSHKLTALIDVNPFVLGTRHRLFNTSPNNDDFSFSYLNQFDNVGSASYNSMEAGLEKRLSDVRILGKIYFKLGWTYAHNIDTTSGFRERNSSVPSYQPGLFRASSDEDLRHQVFFAGGWELPFDRVWKNGPKVLTRGWNLYPIFHWRTGFPLDVFAPLTTSRSNPGPSAAGDSANVHANVNGTVRIFDPKTQTVIGGRAGNYWFDPSVFSYSEFQAYGFDPVNNPSQRTYGTLGRNSFYGPHRTNLDLALSKRTPLWKERVNSEFRLEAFNVCNKAQFQQPSTFMTSSLFGQVSNTYAARELQLALRLTF